MYKSQTISLGSESDIVLLRMRVRDLARSVGMNLADQARVSLAASSLAKAMGLGANAPGQATIAGLARDTQTGVQVICADKRAHPGCKTGSLEEVRWMVDELTLETLPSSIRQARLVKWRN